MSNVFSAIVNLGADPEELTLGERKVYKMRLADKGIGKDATTRWITALVGGPGVNTAARLVKGDAIWICGTLVRKEYKPKTPRFKGEMIAYDDMPFAEIKQVVKSETFFNRDVGDFPPTDTTTYKVNVPADDTNATAAAEAVNAVMEGL